MSYYERFEQTMKTTFADQAKLAAQVYDSKLRHTVTEYTDMKGSKQSAPVLYYDKVEAQEREGRGVQIADNPANRRRRWLKYRPMMTSGELITTEDQLKGMSDFQSALMKTHYAAIRRKIDRDRILEGIFGTAYEGELGETAITFPGTQVIGATVQGGGGSGSVGMNLEKIKTSRKMFALADHDLDMEEPFILVTAEQIDDLSNEIELKSKDYREEAGPQFSRDGKLSKVWNHWFLEFQALPTKITGGRVVQRNPAYLKSCVALGVWQDVQEHTNRQPQMYDELYMWIDANMDCRRLDETGVIEIESDLRAA